MSNSFLGHSSKTAMRILWLGIGFGLLYPLLGRELDDLVAMANGIIIGLFGSLFIIYFEFIYEPFKQKMKFVKKVILKSAVYTCFFAILIPLVIAFTRSIESDKSFLAYVGNELIEFIIYGDYYVIVLYALTFCSIFIFIRQLSRKMGQGVFWNFITGKYHRPREEWRIFMFLDISNSTAIAEKLGDIEYNKFLNMFFFDITNSILETYGEIYRYVGDEVVVTWPLNKGLTNANCIRAFFLAKQEIRKYREKYLINYGLLPEFTAGYHCGNVIVGEIGDLKCQIVFNGDVLYTAAAIEKQCHQPKPAVLVSENIIKLISLPVIYDMSQDSEITSESGKNIKLYEVKEIELATS